MRLATIILFGAFAAACATPAPASSSGTATAAQGETICKRVTLTGTNMPQTQCRTEAEWGAVEKKGRKDVEELERALSETNATTGQ
jgi:hypothetical protein